jgi:hypothetical protein
VLRDLPVQALAQVLQEGHPMIYVGVDIGVGGAVAAIVEGTGGPGDLVLRVWDMPVAKVKKSKKAYDPVGIMEIVHSIHDAALPTFVIWELCHHPRSKPAMSMGMGMGIWTGVTTAMEWGRFTCSAYEWKRHYGLLKAGKGASRLKAEALFPKADLGKRATEDRAEAVMLAMYCRRLARRGQ